MLYSVYHQYKTKYLVAQDVVNDILDEKTIIFQKTQPKSTLGEYEREFDKDVKIMSSGGEKSNVSEAYVIEMEQRHINERLAEAKTIMLDRLDLLRQKETELRASNNKFDVVYVLKYIENLNVGEISEKMSFSEPHVYRLLNIISKNLKMIENERK